MAKRAKVISISNTAFFNTSSSIPSIEEDDKVDEDGNAIMIKLLRVMNSIHGEPRAQFEYLMDTISSWDDTIEELESHIEDGRRRFNLLKQELTNEKHNSFTLSQQIETCELDKAKDLDSIDRALEMSQVLDASKKELEFAHASLTKDLEHLDNAHKLLKNELTKLEENYDQLWATHEKFLGSSSAPINVYNIACAYNSLDM